jgi:hypothetical protein
MNTNVHDKLESKYKIEDEGTDGKMGYTTNCSLHNYSRLFEVIPLEQIRIDNLKEPAINFWVSYMLIIYLPYNFLINQQMYYITK